ncbi:MAG: ABC transporter [Candidatus Tokpelaia hoelldobleri]|uniref:Pyoverdine export ATP-binding/permease protein PvdT n=1 Tax=Candidatus Tokpelaia hoelldobleri TaxID=1902579 RepID=A0A1U9JWI5_9HYPH|nr:MAG: ABC transporter [Candidatus Tokpelaia hoelldoblerii]
MIADKNALIVLSDIRRDYGRGEAAVTILKGINLTINKGEMVAIVGASGSGKSTLMNILGCLDRPTSGSYHIGKQETASLDSDALSQLRRNHFGFIFQRYHLLGELTALGNVEIPAIYAGHPTHMRKERATALLTRLGMGERVNHCPSQLSGGQQQRVSIARALMNDGEIILADEPTGALDKHSGEEVLRILEELHAEGRTIIIVTHDMAVARRAERIIEISDGEILSDSRNKPADVMCGESDIAVKEKNAIAASASFWQAMTDRVREAFRMALLSMNAHRMRTFLTMLGVIIGIAAVVSMVALGNGTQQRILDDMNQMGTNTLTIFAGKSMADVRAAKVTTLVEADARALAEQPYVAAVTPMVSTSSTIRRGAIEANASISGVGEQYFATEGAKLVEGRLFDAASVTSRALDLVIEKDAVNTLFPDGENPIGQTVLVGAVAAHIAGVIETPQRYGPSGDTLSLYLPYTTVQTRFLGNTILRYISLRVAPDADSRLAEQAVTRFLTMRHGSQDFFIRNSQEFVERVMQSANVLTLLVASIALISLLVGGIGVMNIMLVTVSERINEIGVRMAVGARQSDILQQFLIEAVLVCLVGGMLGIALGLSVGVLFDAFGSPFKLVYSVPSIITAFVFSTLIGIVFGYLPARNASKLDPVAALSRD